MTAELRADSFLGMPIDLLLDGIRQRRGLALVTGETGTGKTELCRALVSRAGPSSFTAFLQAPLPIHSREELLARILWDFGVISARATPAELQGEISKPQLIDVLRRFLIGLVPLDATAVLIIDDVQELSPPMLELILELAHLEEDGAPLLQIVLVGHTDFQASLAAPTLAVLDRLVSTRQELEARPPRAQPQEFRASLYVGGLVVLAASAFAVGVSTFVYQRFGF